MDPYGQLLDQFTKKEQDKTLDEKLQIEYHKLFNGIKLQNVKKKTQRSKLKLQLGMLKGDFSKPMKLKQSHLVKQQQNYEDTQPITSKSHTSIIHSSSFTNTLFLSHFDDNNNQEMFMQKKTMIQMEKTSLMEEIDSLVKMINNLRQQKLTAKEELKILTTKQKEMMIIVNEVLGGIEELYTMTKQQKQQNENNKLFYQQHLKKLNVKIKQIAKQNTEYAQQYKQLNQNTTQKHNTSFLDTILSWKSQQNRLKKMQKKLYTKGKLQEMLRALYVINRLAGLNYGNIIQNLIKIAEGEKQGKNQKSCLEEKSEEKNGEEIQLYTDANSGQQLPIKDLIKKLQSNLLTSAQCRFLSKHQISTYYEKNHNVVISSQGQNANSTPNLSQKTQKIIKNIIQHHQKLTSWFSRIEKRNQQLSEYYQSLIKIDDELEKEIKTIQMSSQQKSITYLQARQGQICNLEKVLHQQCKVIFQFNINMYDLIKRFQNLNKFFDQLVKSADKSNRYKKTFVESQNDAMFLKNITKTLFKSPQSIILDWNKVIKNKGANNLTISMNTTLSSNFGLNSNDGFFEKAPQNEVYFETVMKNDLLRIYAQPSLYDPKKSYIDNLQTTFQYVLKEETQIVQKLSQILKQLMIFSKNGIQQVSSKRLIDQRGSQKKLKCSFVPNNLKKEEKKRNNNENKRRQSLSLNKVNPLLQLLQKSNNDLKLDQFFTKDQVKEQQDMPKQNNYYIEQKQLHEKPIFDSNINNNVQQQQQQDNFCIESNDYYRRDNFKIIEKLEKLNLKKRGLLRNVPFFNDTTLELQPTQIKTLNRTMTEKQPLRLGTARKSSINIRSPRISHQLSQSRYNILSERRERESSRKKDLKLLLANISNIASQNQKYRIKKRINLNETMTSASISRINFSSSK